MQTRKTHPGSWRRFGLLMFSMAALLIALVGCSTGTPAAAPSGALIGAKGSYAPLTEPAPTAVPVYVGFYGLNIYDISTSSNTFYASGYLWLRWSGDIDPVATLEFANLVEDWGMTQVFTYEEPQQFDDGSWYQSMRFQGRFAQAFDLSKYPLDSQSLTIYLEDVASDAETIVYLPDEENSGYGTTLAIPGWQLQGLRMDSLLHDYGTAFGDAAAGATFSTLKLTLELERVRNLFVWKLLLPLLIVLATNWLALLLNPTMRDVRTAMPATALLTTVFLHQAAMDAIPQVSSLVLMDYLYVLSYFFIMVTLAQIIWGNNQIVGDEPAAVKRVISVDRISFIVQLALALLIGAALIIGNL
jgi:hypothetical protein